MHSFDCGCVVRGCLCDLFLQLEFARWHGDCFSPRQAGLQISLPSIRLSPTSPQSEVAWPETWKVTIPIFSLRSGWLPNPISSNRYLALQVAQTPEISGIRLSSALA